MDGHSKPQNLATTDHTISKLYTVEYLPGKGQGLVAAQDIPRGARIISEKPLFELHLRYASSEQVVGKYIASKLSVLSKDDQRAFLSLHNSSPGIFHPLFGTFRTNALPLGAGSLDGGLFVQISRINHACLANSIHTWNATIGQETIHALRRIRAGEEITIDYTIGGPFETRSRRLKNFFNFECTCELCSLPLVERAISDERLSQIQLLDNVIDDHGSHVLFSPHQCLDDAYTLLKLLEAENITDSRLHRLYYDAFKIAIACGDQARARVFAERAYEGKLLCEGDDSASIAQLQCFVANPAQHRLFGLSNRWALSVEAIPRKLQGEKFEAWLWRRDK